MADPAPLSFKTRGGGGGGGWRVSHTRTGPGRPPMAASVRGLAFIKSFAFSCSRSYLHIPVPHPRNPQLHGQLSKATRRFTVLSVPKEIVQDVADKTECSTARKKTHLLLHEQ